MKMLLKPLRVALAGTVCAVAIAGCQTPSSGPSVVKSMEVNGARLPYGEQGRGEPVCSCTARSPTTAPGTASARRWRRTAIARLVHAALLRHRTVGAGSAGAGRIRPMPTIWRRSFAA